MDFLLSLEWKVEVLKLLKKFEFEFSHGIHLSRTSQRPFSALFPVSCILSVRRNQNHNYSIDIFLFRIGQSMKKLKKS